MIMRDVGERTTTTMTMTTIIGVPILIAVNRGVSTARGRMNDIITTDIGTIIRRQRVNGQQKPDPIGRSALRLRGGGMIRVH